MHNGSFFSASACTNTLLLDCEDNSWNNISCDWSNFSWEQEIEMMREDSKDKLEEIRKTNVKSLKSTQYDHLKNKLKEFHAEHNDLKQEHYGILEQYTVDLRTHRKNLKEEKKKLATLCKTLANKQDNLEKEVSQLSTHYKHHKEAYKKALNMYQKYFDMNVSIEDSSEKAIKAAVSFGFCKNMEPVRVVVDRNERKIIEVDSQGLTAEENFGENNLDPCVLFNLK